MADGYSRPWRPASRHAFRIAIICALPLEAEMVQSMFDHYWHDDEGAAYGKAAGDQNAYTTGTIGKHNVVLVHMPEIGSNSSATLAAGLRSSFRGIEIAFIVGICGAVPIHRETRKEIVLGDCIISTGIVQYDFGKQYPQGFVSKNIRDDGSGRMTTEIKSLLSMLKTQSNREQLSKRLVEHLRILQSKQPSLAYPGVARDRLFEPSYLHRHQAGGQCDDCLDDSQVCLKDCDSIGCTDDSLIERQRLKDHIMLSPGSDHVLPQVHLGRFGSANTVMKSGLDRDRIADEGQLIAFEMEGSGVRNNFPTLLVKSACDYADSHKSKEWQNYAAATAAAGLKALLERWDAADEILETGLSNLSINKEKRPVLEQQPVSSPSKYMIPLQRNRCFVGRESKLQELEDRLFIQKETQQLAIFGLGGVGKSQLALEFCYTIKARYPDYSIFWVSLISDARYKQDYTKLATMYSLPSDDTDQLTSIVHNFLCSAEAGKWLMVVDNADDKKLVFEDENETSVFDGLLQSDNGVVLFTTRFKEIAVEVASPRNIMSLSEMDLQEAKTFLAKSLRNDILMQDEDSVSELLEELTYLPLAITQASSYITKKSITIPKYLALMRNTEEETVKLLSRDFWDSTKESRNAVAVTWLVTFDQIREEAHIARDMLFFLSYIENKTIPLSILPGGSSDVERIDAVGTLVGYSFLIKQGEDIYDMHRLVQLAVKIWMRREEGLIQEWKQKSIRHLVDILPDCTWETRALWQPMVTHTVRILNDARQDSTFLAGKPRLYIFLAQCLKLEERYTSAYEWALNCLLLEEWEQEDGWFHTKALRYLAMLCNVTGRASEALIIFQYVAGVIEESFPEDDPTQLVAQYDLAGCYKRLGRRAEAVEIMQKVVDKAQDLVDEVEQLGYEHALAEAYHLNGQQKEAIELECRVVAGARRLYEEGHPFQCLCRNLLGKAYLEDERYEDARNVLEEAQILEFGKIREDHPSRLVTQWGLAQVSAATGDSEDALLRMLGVVCLDQISSQPKKSGRTAFEQTLYTMLTSFTDQDLSIEGQVCMLGSLVNKIEGYPTYTFSNYQIQWDSAANLTVTRISESWLHW